MPRNYDEAADIKKSDRKETPAQERREEPTATHRPRLETEAEDLLTLFAVPHAKEDIARCARVCAGGWYVVYSIYEHIERTVYSIHYGVRCIFYIVDGT